MKPAKPRIFLCFRKKDERQTRERLHHGLVAALGREQVFKSGVSIDPGVVFDEVLKTQAAACEVMLVLMGPGWADLRDAGGVRLLDRPGDWVRLEIETALAAGNRVIPVLLGDATMLPRESDLPASIAVLGRTQFLRIEHSRFDTGLRALVGMLTEFLPALAADRRPAGDPGQASSVARQDVRASGSGIAVAIGGSVSDSTLRIGRSGPDKKAAAHE